jgi:hypothetical protein
MPTKKIGKYVNKQQDVTISKLENALKTTKTTRYMEKNL